MGKKKVLNESTIIGRHSTIIEQAHEVLAFVSYIDGVKISPGIITQVKRSKGRAIKFTKTISGLEMKVLGNRSMQSFYVYTNKPDIVAQKINEKFSGKL